MIAVIEITRDGPVVEVEVPGLQGPAGDPLDFGGHIPFPASQNASSDPNTLDDYEEGIFTPTLITSGTQPTGVVYSLQSGEYVKIGKAVLFALTMSLTSKGTGATGNVRIGGLPFTPFNGDWLSHPIAVSNISQISASYTQFMSSGFGAGSVTALNIAQCGNNVALAATPWSALVDTSAFRISGIFML